MKFWNCIGILSILMVISICIVPVAAADDSATDPATLYYNNGVKYISAGDYVNATRSFDAALASNTTLIAMSDTLQYLYEGKAYAQIQLKQFNDALQTSQEGTRRFSQDEKLWNNEGFALYNLGQYQDALNAYNEAISIDGNYTTALINKGGTLYKMGRYQDSVDAYTQALATDPGNKDATDGLDHAQQASSSVSPVLVVLIIIVIVAASGALWYVKFRKPEVKKMATKKAKAKKK
jgi:tetratricopeptide (TPR) repeat protein